jgi:alpha-L-rhamnosidase
VTNHVHPGDNIVEAYVAEGWFSGRLGFRGGGHNIYGNPNALLAQLEIDGQVVACTDETCEWPYGPIITSELYDSEAHGSGGQHPQTSCGGHSIPLLSTDSVSQAPPIRRTEEVSSKEIFYTAEGKMVA